MASAFGGASDLTGHSRIDGNNGGLAAATRRLRCHVAVEPEVDKDIYSSFGVDSDSCVVSELLDPEAGF